MSLISSFDIISIIFPDPKNFLWIPASAGEAAAVNPNDIFLAKGLSTFSSLAGKFSVMVQEVYQGNHLSVLFWVFDNFISFDELHAKALRRLAICLLVNNKFCGKLFLWVPILSSQLC